MGERLKIIERLKEPRSLVALLLAGTALAGCGGNTLSATDRELGDCGSHDYSKAGASHTSKTVGEMLKTAKDDVLTLQRRALNNDGSIDLPRYPGPDITSYGFTEINASIDSLTLNFDRPSQVGGRKSDHVNFSINGTEVAISSGSIACIADNGQTVPNGTYDSLEQYVDQTIALR